MVYDANSTWSTYNFLLKGYGPYLISKIISKNFHIILFHWIGIIFNDIHIYRHHDGDKIETRPHMDQIVEIEAVHGSTSSTIIYTVASSTSTILTMFLSCSSLFWSLRKCTRNYEIGFASYPIYHNFLHC